MWLVMLVVPDQFVDLSYRYTPVRSDSVVGELRLSDPTDIILPGKSVREELSLPYVIN